LKDESLVVLDSFFLDEIKTKKFLSVVEALKVKNVLIVTDESNKNLELSARNVPGVKILRSEGLNVYDILKYKHLVLLEASVKDIEGRLLS
jgi:large subunit ribosomal protein L4